MENQQANTPRVELVNVTPSMAEEFLKKNTGNRTIRESRVRTYTELMRRGEWTFSNDGIGFFDDGTLANGQHRLLAIIRSGETVPMTIFYGLPKTPYMDTGLARTQIDNIKMADADMEWTRPRHGAMANILRYEFPDVISLETITDKANYMKKYKSAFQAVDKIYVPPRECSNGLRGAPIYAAFLVAYIDGADEEMLKSAAMLLNRGLLTKVNDPGANSMLKLRESLINKEHIKKKTFGTGSNHIIFSYATYALAAYLRGEGISSFPDKALETCPFHIFDVNGNIVYDPDGNAATK